MSSEQEHLIKAITTMNAAYSAPTIEEARREIQRGIEQLGSHGLSQDQAFGILRKAQGNIIQTANNQHYSQAIAALLAKR